MGLFRDEKKDIEYYDIYGLEKSTNKKKLIIYISTIVVLIILIVIILCFIINAKINLRKKEIFESQILEYTQQEQDKKDKKQKEKKKKIPVMSDNSKEQMKHIYTSESKRAFLTFDDGPSENTEDILKILKEKKIKATFFMLGSQIERMPETVKKVYKAGHYIANHGYSHVYESIYASPENVLDEYQRTNELVKNVLQLPEYNTYIFRFPGGSTGGKYVDIKNEAISLLEQNNILYVDWNALTGDSEIQDPTEEYLMNNLQETTQNKNSVVILMHDSQNKRITVDFLTKAIEFLEQQGFSFKSFYEIMK